jgi:hypothetical protein
MNTREKTESGADQERLASECRRELQKIVATSGICLDIDFEFDPAGPDKISLGIHLTKDTLNPIGNFWLVPELVDRLEEIQGGLVSLCQLCYGLARFSSEPKR